MVGLIALHYQTNQLLLIKQPHLQPIFFLLSCQFPGFLQPDLLIEDNALQILHQFSTHLLFRFIQIADRLITFILRKPFRLHTDKSFYLALHITRNSHHLSRATFRLTGSSGSRTFSSALSFYSSHGNPYLVDFSFTCCAHFLAVVTSKGCSAKSLNHGSI